MRKCLLLFINILFCLSSFAQTFSINGTVTDEKSQSVAFANATLLQKNKIVRGATTNELGEFTIENIPVGDYKLAVSFVGFQTLEFELENISNDIKLGNITLQTATTELQGATVKSHIVKITQDRRLVYPTKQQLATTADGVTLLNAMKLPQLSVVPASNEINYWGKGELAFYINDREATIKEIRALAPKDIVRVEYIDRPSVEYGQNTGLVLRYITKQYERGATNSIDIDKALNRNEGSANIQSRINYKNSEFAVNYDGSYQNSKRHFDQNKTDETFNLNSGAQYRREYQTGNISKEYNNDVALLYTYSRPQKELFYLKAEYAFLNTPNSDSKSILYNSGVRNDTTMKYNNMTDNEKTYSAVAYFRKYLTPKQFVLLKASYYFLRTNNSNNYRETTETATINDIYTNISGKSQMLSVQAAYSNQFSEKWGFIALLQNQYDYVNNRYTGTSASVSKIIKNLTTMHTQLSYTSEKYSGNAYLLLRSNHTRILDAQKYTRYEFISGFDFRYLFNDRTYIGASLIYSPAPPKIEDLSTATQIIDDVQVRRGNPNAKTGYFVSPSVEGNIGIKKLDIHWFANYEYNHNDIQEKTFLENGVVIRMPYNFKHIHVSKMGVEVSPNLFDWLNFSAAVQYNYFRTKDSAFHKTYDNLSFRLNATATYKKWTLSVTAWTHHNDFNGETMWTGGRAIIFTLGRVWFDGRLATSLSMYNPFSRNYSKEGTINYSHIAPYENWTYNNYSFRYLKFGISYKFNIGHKSSSMDIKTDVETNAGYISNKKAAEKK